ncbi:MULTISPECIES: 4-hydroxyphenylacetate 3-hydroxylase N-terminal domain-containing protein [Phyllobacteriaceae]|jgi:hypothetical protein|uniref:HpaB/PvcC/4-BUDH N-terminal domain-containing protein n=1 Tax=Mesorhizobium hungaricum TaxID=1566387 RepID=A0A1C2E119_9HYPH|nr:MULTISPECIES: 4-hydroxyphenylacetate 3-hydroxylase N-terminal domain-containing protein [Mesorhizobium]MBN9235541.1 hypothetical protein [Mesorhizobium sp.]MDQ0331305.1 hypothetical protein [Mesorhizobium sp. YL-MeA3-2017]OCX20679.1 hypothetical protein QV13_08360 [Mesorhizobium hungaricum]
MIKTGAQHIEMLRDGRQVYINGQPAGDVSVHPAFRRTIQSIGALYDFQARSDNRDLMTFEIPEKAIYRTRFEATQQANRSNASAIRRATGADGRNTRDPRPSGPPRPIVARYKKGASRLWHGFSAMTEETTPITMSPHVPCVLRAPPDYSNRADR